MVKKGWKLFRTTKHGIRSLFIDKTRPLPEGEWLQCKVKPTKGYAERPGWHVMLKPEAPHLSLKNRVWRQVEVSGKIDTIERPASQGGTWMLATLMKILPEDNS